MAIKTTSRQRDHMYEPMIPPPPPPPPPEKSHIAGHRRSGCLIADHPKLQIKLVQNHRRQPLNQPDGGSHRLYLHPGISTNGLSRSLCVNRDTRHISCERSAILGACTGIKYGMPDVDFALRYSCPIYLRVARDIYMISQCGMYINMINWFAVIWTITMCTSEICTCQSQIKTQSRRIY